MTGKNDTVEMTRQWSGNEAPERTNHFQTATAIARDYPTARDFLSQVAGFSEEQLDQYPKAQVVFLAIVKYHEFAQDEAMKQFVLPNVYRSSNDESELLQQWTARFNPSPRRPDLKNSLLPLADIFVPGTRQVLDAAALVDQQQNLWQTVEALRLTAADNDGQFPESLEQLAVPAPLDPKTNQPFKYELDGEVAILRAAKLGSRQYEIRLELANQDESKENHQ